MVSNTRSWFSLVGAVFFGAGLTLTLGANSPKTPVYPKYSVYNNGPFLHITDNDTNKQFIYINSGDKPSRYLGYIDLSDAGKPEIRVNASNLP